MPADPRDVIPPGLIVSCQAYPGEPMRDPAVMTAVARAVEEGGAVAVRGQGLDDLRGMVAALTVPVVGLVKQGDEGVYITPALDLARAVADLGCQVVALDGTRRPRPDGLTLAETVAGLRETHDVLTMADCGSLDDALAAVHAGCDIVGTTLAGYTGERPPTEGPDWELLEQVVAEVDRPVVAEGRFRTPDEVARALDLGAHAVCVGTAITHPTSITRAFVAALPTAGRG
ncbi:N-acetylmannosamine-6-phosphate 2-epimerase [Ornithinimicrobium sp. Y1847]|uniref:N-acetylmannosamine-6-phosphate 2-epimerase n=1 Tax=Ornithinimicrobium sp. Y1847 TaxID=3405419 RepID=UPI003B67A197